MLPLSPLFLHVSFPLSFSYDLPPPTPHPPVSPRLLAACVSRQNNGWTALLQASYEGHVAVVQYLVETAKADVNVKNVSGAGQSGVNVGDGA